MESGDNVVEYKPYLHNVLPVDDSAYAGWAKPQAANAAQR